MRNGHKYGAVPTVVDGVRFASKAEAARYGELKLLEKAGEITGLVLQPRFPITYHGLKISTYVADFKYFLVNGAHPVGVVEDVKGVSTTVYRLKKKLVEAQYGIVITEVGKGQRGFQKNDPRTKALSAQGNQASRQTFQRRRRGKP